MLDGRDGRDRSAAKRVGVEPDVVEPAPKLKELISRVNFGIEC